MWRNIGKHLVSSSKASTRKSHSFGFSQDSVILNSFKLRPLTELNSCSHIQFRELGFHEFLPRDEFSVRKSHVDFNLLSPKSYASVAEAALDNTVDLVEEESRNVSVDNNNNTSVNLSVPDSVSEGVGEELIIKEKKKEDRKQWRMGNSKYIALRKRQVKIETEAWEQAAKEYRELLDDMCQYKLAPNLPFVKSLFLGWFEPLRTKIEEEQLLIRAGKNKMNYAKYFDHLPADKMAVIAMHKLVGLLMSGGEHGHARVVNAACIVGEAIEHEVKIHKFLEDAKKKKEKKAGKKTKKEEGEEQEEELHVCSPKQTILHYRVTKLMKRQKLRAVRKIVDEATGLQPWGLDARAKVGSHLIDLIIQTAYIQPPADQPTDNTEVRPAFEHTLKTIVKGGQKSRRVGVIQCDPLVREGLERSARHMVMPYMPMLVPPAKWTGYDKGAYLYLSSYIMRTHGSRQQREAVKKVSSGQLRQVYEALDTLGRTRWRVNKRVLSIIDRIWASGGCLGGLVDRSDIPLPQQPDTEDESLLKIWKWEIQNTKKTNSERHSLRCDTELKLAVARKMEDEEGFFYPHNIDFRGRAYPMHPHLNHLGSDICRGILEFAEGRPLGKSGLQWLKIHLANLFGNGVDKLSHEGRVAFVENHLDDIFDSADRPLEGKRWWLDAEEPFQCLATCINLSEALRSQSPETTISHIPVHQDGSCNGLQHYAALGRDKVGAISVNLVAGEKPADVYSGIALRVLDIMRMDAEKDPAEFAEASHARLLVNQVDRKLVKQTVMTSVYGVTYTGARDQIFRRLKERGSIADSKELYVAACYAAKVTLTALEQMFEAARKIMSWLGDSAKVIAEQNQAVRWTTPLGLPVVQPYRKIGSHHVKTSLQVLTLQHESEKILAKKQKTAFAPNFVHSLDGSHMMMTAIACNKAGLNFAGVHDSYWTHACDVDQMSTILREKFVELYDEPILENLLEEFEKTFPQVAFPPLPERGDFDLRDVLQSPYFFN